MSEYILAAMMIIGCLVFVFVFYTVKKNRKNKLKETTLTEIMKDRVK